LDFGAGLVGADRDADDGLAAAAGPAAAGPATGAGPAAAAGCGNADVGGTGPAADRADRVGCWDMLGMGADGVNDGRAVGVYDGADGGGWAVYGSDGISGAEYTSVTS